MSPFSCPSSVSPCSCGNGATHFTYVDRRYCSVTGHGWRFFPRNVNELANKAKLWLDRFISRMLDFNATLSVSSIPALIAVDCMLKQLLHATQYQSINQSITSNQSINGDWLIKLRCMLLMYDVLRFEIWDGIQCKTSMSFSSQIKTTGDLRIIVNPTSNFVILKFNEPLPHCGRIINKRHIDDSNINYHKIWSIG